MWHNWWIFTSHTIKGTLTRSRNTKPGLLQSEITDFGMNITSDPNMRWIFGGSLVLPNNLVWRFTHSSIWVTKRVLGLTSKPVAMWKLIMWPSCYRNWSWGSSWQGFQERTARGWMQGTMQGLLSSALTKKVTKQGRAWSWGLLLGLALSKQKSFLNCGQSQHEMFVCLEAVCWAVTTYNIRHHTYTHSTLDHTIHI